MEWAAVRSPQDVQRVQTNPDGYLTLMREQSGPCPLRRVRDIVSKPHTWNHIAGFETQSAGQNTGTGNDRTPPASGPYDTGVTSRPQPSTPPTLRGVPEESNSAGDTLLRRICIYLVLPSPTESRRASQARP